jgi:hypothetical protein
MMGHLHIERARNQYDKEKPLRRLREKKAAAEKA